MHINLSLIIVPSIDAQTLRAKFNAYLYNILLEISFQGAKSQQVCTILLMTAVNSQRQRRRRRRRQRQRQLRRRAWLQCRHHACLLLVCVSCTSACSLLASRCTKLCRVQSTYADWSTTKRRVSSGANPKPPELCGCMVVWPGNKSNLDDVYGAADDGESSTICPLCLSPSLSLLHFLSLFLSVPCGVPCGLLEVLLHDLLGCTRCLHAV